MSIESYLHAEKWDGSERRGRRDPDYEGPERRHARRHRPVSAEDLQERYIAQQFGNIEDELTAGRLRMDKIDAVLADQTEILNDIRAIMDFSKSGLKILGYVGVAARWIASIATAVAVIYGLFHLTNQLPKGKP